MKIAKHVGDLLYDYECVVIPGLGGFLTQDKPSSINPVTHQFRPPYKQVSFNAFLKTNDGLLINYVARQEGMDYKNAKEQVDQFVMQCDKALHQGKKIHFHNVGYLYLNDNKQIVFSQDPGINYNPEAFGLGSFVSPAITRTTAEEKIHEKVTAKVEKTINKKTVDRKTKTVAPQQDSRTQEREKKHGNLASERRSPYRTQITFLVLLLIAMFVGWGFMNKTTVQHYYNNYSSVIPLFYTTPNECLIDNIHRLPISNKDNKSGLWIVNLFSNSKKEVKATPKALPVKKVENKVKRLKKKVNHIADKPVYTSVAKKADENKSQLNSGHRTDEKTNTSPTTTSVQPAKKVVQPVKTQSVGAYAASQKHYFIIAGAFRNKSNAVKLIQKLQVKGYPALSAGVTSTGLFRVAFGDFDNRRKAQQQLLAIREKENPSAWIFEK